MEKTKQNPLFYISRRFRIPSTMEQELGFWVDRIGVGVNIRNKVDTMRILGLYGLVFIKTGTGTFVNEVTGITDVHSGQVMVVFPDIPTSYWPETAWETEWVVFGGSEPVLWEQMGLLDRNNPVIQPGRLEFQSVFDYLKESWNDSREIVFVKRREKIISLLISFSKKCEQHQLPFVFKILEKYRKICRDDSGKISRLEDCALESGFSIQYLRRKFKEYYGQSFQTFIKELRMTRAKEFLAAGNTIKETAHKVGIQDELYFMRQFKQFWGITAGQFQRGMGSL